MYNKLIICFNKLLICDNKLIKNTAAALILFRMKAITFESLLHLYWGKK